MRITLRQLQLFKRVYETRQISKAAKDLTLSVSAVSQGLQELESSLNSDLFLRSSTGLKPTQGAQMLYPRAVLLLKKAHEIEQLFLEQHNGEAGTVSIGANRNFGIYILSRRLPGFKARCPNINTVLKIDDNAKIESAVLNHEIDIGFVSRKPENALLESFICFEDRRCIVVGATSSIPYLGMKIEDLSEATWILDEEARVRESVVRWLNSKGVYITQSIVMSQMGAIKRAVGTGYGVACLPYVAVVEELKRGELLELFSEQSRQQEEKRHIYAIYKKEHCSLLVQRFLDECNIRKVA